MYLDVLHLEAETRHISHDSPQTRGCQWPDRQLHASFMISVGGNKTIPGYLHVAANTDNRQTAFKRASQPDSAGQALKSEKKRRGAKMLI